MAAIWCEVLGRPQVSVRDKFFDIGGDSLKVVRVTLMLNERYPSALTVVDLFNHTTVESIGAFLDDTYLSRQTVGAIEGIEL